MQEKQKRDSERNKETDCERVTYRLTETEMEEEGANLGEN